MAKDEKELSGKDLEEVTGGVTGTSGLDTGPSDSGVGDFGHPNDANDGTVTPGSGGKPER